MDKSATILATKDLTVGYKNGSVKEVLFSDLDLSAAKSSLICLLGENGIGKSSLLRTLANLQAPLHGEILINGNNVNNISKQALAKLIALVLTQSPQGINFSIKELVALGRFPHTSWHGKLQKEDLEKVEYALEVCEITDFRNKNIYQVSDGQFQKALIARALAQDCPIMILDEPTVHLDANNRYLIMQLLKKIAHESEKTIIMSTHQISMATELADRIWLAKKTNELIVNTPDELIKSNILQEVFPFEKY